MPMWCRWLAHLHWSMVIRIRSLQSNQALGLMSHFGGFVSQHQNSHICWTWNIPFLVGWCEKLGHRNHALLKWCGKLSGFSWLMVFLDAICLIHVYRFHWCLPCCHMVVFAHGSVESVDVKGSPWKHTGAIELGCYKATSLQFAVLPSRVYHLPWYLSAECWNSVVSWTRHVPWKRSGPFTLS